MADHSNWPPSRKATRVSSHPEPDKPLYPSRLGRKQINPWIPIPLHDRLRDYLHVNRPLTLQDFVSDAIEEKLKREAADNARAAVQTGSRADGQSCSHSTNSSENSNGTEFEDQITDLKLTTDSGSNQISDIPPDSARASVQFESDAQLLEALSQRLPPQAFETWFKGLRIRRQGDVAVIASPNSVVSDWIVSKYSDVLQAALLETGVTQFTWSVPEPLPETPAETHKQPTAADAEDELLTFYGVVTDNIVRPYDREAFKLVAHCSIESVKAGILQSRTKAKPDDSGRRKVRSLRYCLPAILAIEQTRLGPRRLPALEKEYQQLLEFESKVLPLKK